MAGTHGTAGASPLDPILRALDAGTVVLAGLAAHMLRFGEATPNRDYASLMLISALLVLLIFPLFGLYRSWRGESMVALLGRLVTAWGVVFVTLAVLLFAFKLGGEYSRLWFFLWGGAAGAGLVLLRLSAYAWLHALRKRGLNRKRIAIVGTGPAARDIARRAHQAPWAGFEVAIIVTPQGHPPQEGALPQDALPEAIRELRLDELWIALPLREEAVIQELLHVLRHETLNIRYVPDISSLRLINHDISTILGVPMLNLRSSPMTGMNRWIKALEDFSLAALFLLLATPAMLLIAMGIRLTSPGPILFKQARHGWGGREIRVYKFRTMHVAPDTGADVRQATRDDPRVTPLGAFLRRTSLDELPQLFNVLQGRMSLVGPRPHAVEHNELFMERIDSYMQRHKVKPGITGWAQVNGYRGETDTLEKMQKRVEYDLYYIEHWSLWFDLKIIFMTMFKGFVHKNAY